MFGKRIGKIQEREVEGLSEGNCIINLWLPKKVYSECLHIASTSDCTTSNYIKNYPNQEEFYVSRLGYKGYLNCNHTSYIQAGFIQKKVEDVYYYSSIILTDKSQGTDNNYLLRTVIYMQ